MHQYHVGCSVGCRAEFKICVPRVWATLKGLIMPEYPDLKSLSIITHTITTSVITCYNLTNYNYYLMYTK